MGASIQPLDFIQLDCTASQSGVALKVGGGAAITDIVMPWAGAIVGISADVEADRTGGTCKVNPTIGGTAKTALEAKIDDVNVRHHYASVSKDAVQFAAGALIGAKVTTDGSWAAGTTPELVVTVYVQRYLSET